MSNKLVLIADDEVHIREVISYTLQNAGLEVIVAQDSEEALELAKSEHPDLLITDYQMPGPNGIDLCLELRQDPQTQQIPAIMLTARGLDITQDKLDQAGIKMVVAKPFSPREVLSCAEELLEQEDIYSRSSEQANDVKSLSRHLGETYEELNFIYKLNNAMNVTADPEEYFGQIAEDLGKLLGVRAVMVALSAETLICKEKGTTVIHWGELPVSEEQIMERLRPQMQVRGGDQVRSESSHCPTWSSNDAELGNILLAPIVRGERQLGIIIALGSTEAREFDNIDATRLSNVANSAAVFLENFRLYGSLRQLFLGSMRALTSSIDAKDPYTCGHSERVALLSKRLAEIMGWSKAQAERIYLCGLLHDIGKIGVPEAVLQKPGKLTNIEFDLIKKHPVIGAKIIRGIQEMEDLVPGVLHHHECMDGRGYPGGLKGEAIPIQARVLCVADALDAMTSDRPYRKAMPARLAESEVFRAADTQFDSDLVEAVLKLNFPEYLGELRTYKGIQLPENSYDPQDQIHTNS